MQGEGEHLHIYCSCGYEWTEQTKGAPERPEWANIGRKGNINTSAPEYAHGATRGDYEPGEEQGYKYDAYEDHATRG